MKLNFIHNSKCISKNSKAYSLIKLFAVSTDNFMIKFTTEIENLLEVKKYALGYAKDTSYYYIDVVCGHFK